MARIREPWATYLVVMLPVTVLVLALPDGPFRWVLHALVGLSAATAIVVGDRLAGGRAPGVWYAAAATQVLWVTADAVQAWGGRTAQAATAHLVAGALYLGAYLLMAVAATLAARLRSGTNARNDLLGAATHTAPIALVAWVVLVEPGLGEWLSGRAGDPPLELAFPLAVVVVLGGFIRLATAPGIGRRAAVAPAALIGLTMLLDVAQVTDVPLLASYPAPFDARWLLFYPLAGAVVLAPVGRVLTAPGSHHRPAAHQSQILWLVAAMLTGPALLAWQVLRGTEPSVLVTAAFSAATTLLAGARMRQMLRVINARATTDDLPGLPNRRALHSRAESHLSDPAIPHALLLLDLDRFKEINDSLGHHAGDELLVQVAERVGGILGAQDVLARLGGDEFAILLHDQGGTDAETVAVTVEDVLREAFDLGTLTVHTSASIGIAVYPDHGANLPALLRLADAAMYRAKTEGRAMVHAPGDDDHTRRLQLVEELRDGLDRGELLAHYQPKIELATGRVAGVEALVRGQHPTRSLLLPGEFLHRAEEAGLMTSLTTEVLRIALDQAAAWAGAGRPLQVAVNLSASSVVDADLPSHVIRLLASRGLPTHALQLEITEAFVMSDRVRAQAVLGALRAAGVSIAVDDFGTGYSSLAYLRDLPIDELKLDRSFVRPMIEDARAGALVESTVSLAHSLGLRMVAEGVEDLPAYRRLAELGCDQAQGYHLSPAVPAAALADWLDAWPGPKPWDGSAGRLPRQRGSVEVA